MENIKKCFEIVHEFMKTQAESNKTQAELNKTQLKFNDVLSTHIINKINTLQDAVNKLAGVQSEDNKLAQEAFIEALVRCCTPEQRREIDTLSKYLYEQRKGGVYSAKKDAVMNQPVNKPKEEETPQYPPFTLQGGAMSEAEYFQREGLPYGNH